MPSSTDPGAGIRGPSWIRGQGLVFHRAGPTHGRQQSADGNGRGRRFGGKRKRERERRRRRWERRWRKKAQETATHIGRDGADIGGGGGGGDGGAIVPVPVGGRRLLRVANTGRCGRRPGRTADGRLLRRVRSVRGQRATADGPAIGDHRQAASERGAVPGPDGHVEREHADRDAAVVVGPAEERNG